MTAREPPARTTPSGSPWRHWTGFLLGGAAAFAIDSALTMLLTRLAGAPVLIARLFAIGAAMLASWLINRTITFPVAGPPSLREFAQFAAIAWIAAAVNYAIFAAIVFLVPNLNPVFGIAAASLCAMTFSYFGMRYGVFTK